MKLRIHIALKASNNEDANGQCHCKLCGTEIAEGEVCSECSKTCKRCGGSTRDCKCASFVHSKDALCHQCWSKSRTAKDVSTKNGLKLDITKKVDIEGDKNRGWQVDLYTATVKGSQVGYLKVEYIPKERFERNYPTIFHYLDKQSGWSLGLRKGEPEGYLDSEEFFKRVCQYSDAPRDWWNGNIPDKKEQKRYLRNVAKRHEPEFRKFREFWEDKPMVGFIRVRDGQDTYSDSWGGIVNTRIGVGMELP